MLLHLFVFFIVGFTLSKQFSADFISDTNHYAVSYRLSSDLLKDEFDKIVKETPHRVVPIKTAENENYNCILPVTDNGDSFDLDGYKGPSPAQLLKSMYDERIVSIYGNNGFWMYDMAHGRYILQYHESKDNKGRTEYYLGNYRLDQTLEDEKKFDPFHPPITTINNVNYPYYPVIYRHGTACDLTGKPRQTTVLYICHDNVRSVFHSISEVSTCNYEVVILTQVLCQHPAFSPPTRPEYDIQCYNADATSQKSRPVALRDLEQKSYNEHYEQYAAESGKSTATFKSAEFSNIISQKKAGIPFAQRPTGRIDNHPEESFGNPPTIDDIMDNQFKVIEDLFNKNEAMMQELSRSLSDEDLVLMDAFWAGRSCFIGGTGYWRFEICYGSKVTQFHIENQKRTKEIVLGEFNADDHRKWFKKNKKQALKLEGSMVRQVTNFYANGDFCDEINEQRSVQVIFRCRPPTEDSTPSIVLMSLEEPSTCTYSLVLESTLLCEGLQLISEDGFVVSNEHEEYIEHKSNRNKIIEQAKLEYMEKRIKQVSDEIEAVKKRQNKLSKAGDAPTDQPPLPTV